MNRPWIKPLILSVIILFIGAYGAIHLYSKWDEQEITIKNPAIHKVAKNSDVPDLKSIIHHAEKNVLLIEGKNEDFTMTGSGFLYNDKGDIITNAHVIKDADIIYVRTANAHIYPAAVVGISDKTDIAVIRVPQLVQPSYLAVEREVSPEIGDEIIALGSPHGFQNTVTLGIISGTERNFSVDGFDYNNVYQISAQISQGNSGGPLIDRRTGHVIGINSVGTEDGMIGFSIPISEVLDIVEQWSEEITDADLHYASMSDVIMKHDPEKLKQDAEYLIEYFYDNIRLSEYIDAYTLLGSNVQSNLSYVSFKENYTHVVRLEHEITSSEITDQNQVKNTVHVTVHKKGSSHDDIVTNKVVYTFTVGLENDQLKILELICPDL